MTFKVIIEILGLVAGICTCGASVPQLIKILRSRNTSGVSLFTNLMLAFGNCLWMIYGIITGGITMVISNAFGLVTFSIICGLKIADILRSRKSSK